MWMEDKKAKFFLPYSGNIRFTGVSYLCEIV